MLNRPKRLKVSSIDDFSTKRKEMFVVTLRKYIFIVFTSNIYRKWVSMLQTPIRKSKIFTRNSQSFFHHFPTINYLMLQLRHIIIIDAIMIQCMCTKQITFFLKYSYLLPSHRMLSWTFCCVHSKVFDISLVTLISSVRKIRINKNIAFTPYLSNCGAI